MSEIRQVALIPINPAKVDEVKSTLKEFITNVKSTAGGSIEITAAFIEGEGGKPLVIFAQKFKDQDAVDGFVAHPRIAKLKESGLSGDLFLEEPTFRPVLDVIA